ncbi:hypothetical protein B0H34DRAFT_722091 [Crassisporium funariophilum]|nr:hypothetical protein B0H34DRAFT_722091 [Crassisporium funariophilum]
MTWPAAFKAVHFRIHYHVRESESSIAVDSLRQLGVWWNLTAKMTGNSKPETSERRRRAAFTEEDDKDRERLARCGTSLLSEGDRGMLSRAYLESWTTEYYH